MSYSNMIPAVRPTDEAPSRDSDPVRQLFRMMVAASIPALAAAAVARAVSGEEFSVPASSLPAILVGIAAVALSYLSLEVNQSRLERGTGSGALVILFGVCVAFFGAALPCMALAFPGAPGPIWFWDYAVWAASAAAIQTCVRHEGRIPPPFDQGRFREHMRTGARQAAVSSGLGFAGAVAVLVGQDSVGWLQLALPLLLMATLILGIIDQMNWDRSCTEALERASGPTVWTPLGPSS